MNSESLQKMKLENQNPYKQPDLSLLRTNTVSITCYLEKVEKYIKAQVFSSSLQSISKLLIYIHLVTYCKNCILNSLKLGS